METPLQFADVQTPIGTFRVVYHERTVRVIDLVENGVAQTGPPAGAVQRRGGYAPESPPRQLSEYFRGRRASFDLEVEPDTGSAFDRRVWKELLRVPYGATVTYGELARRAGFSGAARAVGGSMGRNPIPIVIPCHRVVGKSRSLTGFGLGLWRKRWLLDREGAWPLRSRSIEGPRPRAQRTLDSLMESEAPRTRKPQQRTRKARAPPPATTGDSSPAPA